MTLRDEEEVTVHVKYGGMEQTFSGNVDDVWIAVNKFFGETVPAFEIARKVTLTVDLARLVEDFRDIVAIASEGPVVLLPKDKLTDGEALQLHLLAAYMGYRLGRLAKDSLTREELQTRLGKNMKITTTRLGELVKQGTVIKTKDGEYRITTAAVVRIQREKTKLGS
jgi:hypothetical protein